MGIHDREERGSSKHSVGLEEVWFARGITRRKGRKEAIWQGQRAAIGAASRGRVAGLRLGAWGGEKERKRTAGGLETWGGVDVTGQWSAREQRREGRSTGHGRAKGKARWQLHCHLRIFAAWWPLIPATSMAPAVNIAIWPLISGILMVRAINIWDINGECLILVINGKFHLYR